MRSPTTPPWPAAGCSVTIALVLVLTPALALALAPALALTMVGVYGGGIHAIPRGEGDATVHSSSLLHAVSRMVRGVRYSLIMFFAFPS